MSNTIKNLRTAAELMKNPDVYTVWETITTNSGKTKAMHSQYTHWLDANIVCEALEKEHPDRKYDVTNNYEVNRWTVLPENQSMWCVEICYDLFNMGNWQYGEVHQYETKVVNLGDGPEGKGNDFYVSRPTYPVLPGLFRVDRIVAQFYDDAKDVAFRLFNQYVKEKAKELADAVDNANNFVFSNGML